MCEHITMETAFFLLVCLLGYTCHVNGYTLPSDEEMSLSRMPSVPEPVPVPIEVSLPEPDTRTNGHRNGGKASKLLLGCYPDLIFPSHVYTRSQNTATTCIRTCRQQHFKFAGLQNGVECYCSSEDVRGPYYEQEEDYTDRATCNACPGDPEEECGGTNTVSVYVVPEDRRYFGCYDHQDNLVFQWSEQRAAHACVDACTNNDYHVAAVQDGGACYCGHTYSDEGPAEEELCNVTCYGYTRQNCGGEDTNSIFMTERGVDFSIPEKDPLIVSLYDESGQMTEVNFNYFAEFEKLRSVVTKKFVLTASDMVVGLQETDCLDNCYSPCGDIYHPQGFDNKGETLIIRVFHLNLKDVPSYVAQDTKRLFIYAQTVVVDASLDIDFALLIRARQVLIDRSSASQFSVKVSPDAPDLDREDIRKDAQAELMFLKQSIMCGQILLDTKRQEDYNLALAILDDVSKTQTDDDDVFSFVQQVKAITSEFVGIMRADIHYVPIYTKAHVSEILDTFATEIGIYNDEFNRIIDKELSNRDYLNAVETMNAVFTETAVEEAMVSFDSAMISIYRSNGTYRSMYQTYVESFDAMEESRKTYEDNLEQSIINNAKKGALRSTFALFTKGFRGFLKSVKEAADVARTLRQVGIMVENLANAITEVSRITDSISEMDDIVDELIERLVDIDTEEDVMQFNDNIETVVALAINVIEWQNVMDQCDIVMTDSDVQSVPGHMEYRMSINRVILWGQAVSQGAIDFAESLRIATEKRVVLEAKIEQQERMEELMDDLRGDPEEREQMTYALMEQTYEVRLDLNVALVTFCRAYFFENLYECKEAYKPSFGGSLKDLLLKINAARKFALLIGDAPSSVERMVRIEDTDTSAECEDMMTCPVNYFRKHRILYYTIPVDHDDLWDLDKYRVAEVQVYFDGVTSQSDDTLLKLNIQTTGAFEGRSQNQVYSFLSRGASLVYEYDIEDGRVSWRADVYAPMRDSVSHTTPYTTWMIQVSEGRSHGIDVSGVSNVRLMLRGSAVNNGS